MFPKPSEANKEIIQEAVAVTAKSLKRRFWEIDNLSKQSEANKKNIQAGSRLKVNNILCMARQWFPSSQITRSLQEIEVAQVTLPQACDVFINHQGADTKRTIAALLYDRLVHLNLHPFLDCYSMEAGDKLFESIEWAIQNCKVGVTIFSPQYFRSYFCLHELALLVEAKKKLIPIFWDVKPSQLLEVDHMISQFKEVERFRRALKEARYTVGFVFDSHNGNWSDLLTSASDIIVKSLSH